MAQPALTNFIAGRSAAHEGAAAELFSPARLRGYARLVDSGAEAVAAAIADAQEAQRRQRRSTVLQRAQWLEAAAAAVAGAEAELIELIIHDIGKPRRAATFEVQRAAQYLKACAGTVLNLAGETVPVDAAPAGAGRFGFTMRIPFGVVAGITPFNAPINLLCQKVAPALAAGNAIVVKPHPAGTRVALKVAQLFAAAGTPAGLFNVVTGDREAATRLAGHADVAAVSFTGSTAGGEALVRIAGAKKFVSELGSNSANVVLADADLADAAKRIAAAAFEASGQQCVSAQRVIVEKGVFDRFLEQFVAAARALKVGDPYDAATDLGPMVSREAARRVMRMASDTIAAGGRFALEPVADECTVSPGILVGAPRETSIWCDEVFGPLAVVVPAADAEEALALANDSPFGLQGSLFTRSLPEAMRFARDFDVGALWINEASRFRLDMYPFGGVKRSGTGREGIKYSIEEMSQLKFVGMRFDV